MRLTTHTSYAFYPAAVAAFFLDICLFFSLGSAHASWTLALFALHLSPPASYNRLGFLIVLLCLASFATHGTLFSPLIFLLPAALAAPLIHRRIYLSRFHPFVWSVALGLAQYIVVEIPNGAPLSIAYTALKMGVILLVSLFLSLIVRERGR